MTETTNLKLPIYGASDVPDWMNTNDGFEALDSLVNSCADVQLDWGNPLHTFSTGNLSYTVAEDDCYLCGLLNGGSTDNILSINNTSILLGYSGGGYIYNWIEPLKLSKGDVVAVTSTASLLHVFKGKLVSGNTYVFNEAEVTLDYGNPLHTFNSAGSYTAIEDCWVVGACLFGNLSINNTRVGYGEWGSPIFVGTEIMLPVHKGDVITCDKSESRLHVLRGTVSGSVDALHSNVPDYSNLIASLAYNDETYTATEECIVEMQALALSAGTTCVVKINGNNIGFSLNDAGGYIPFDKTIHLQKGDVLTWNNAHSRSGLFVCNVFGIL